MLNYLYSIHPQPIADILNLRKTAELRTRIPRDMKQALDNGEKVVMWIYCTYNGGLLQRNLDEDKIIYLKGAREIPLKVALSPMNGLVVAKCVVDGYTVVHNAPECFYTEINDFQKEFDYKTACVTYGEMRAYANGRPLYALHLTQVEILDKPLPITVFQSYTCKKFKGEKVTITDDMPMSEKIELLKKTGGYRFESNPLTRAPQSYQRVLAPEGK